MKGLFYPLLFFPLLAFSQLVEENIAQVNNAKGIHWVAMLTWEEVKIKAKEQNKYIFIDCFATWCGPCKRMDKEVFQNDTVADFMNKKFICVKVQMDRTDSDNQYIQQWYENSEIFRKQYNIMSFPCFVFLSPNGNLVQKQVGYKRAMEFRSLAETAIKPGQVYVDPNKDYYDMVYSFRNGKRDYSQMPYLIRRAKELLQQDISSDLELELKTYLDKLPFDKLLTKQYIDFLASLQLTSQSRYFKLFYRHGKRINRIMGIRNYSRIVIDDIIQREIVNPFLKIKGGGAVVIMQGGPVISKEVQWLKLHEIIRVQYNNLYARRNVLDAQIKLYSICNNYSALYRCLFESLEINGIDTLKGNTARTPVLINYFSWNVFETVTDKRVLKLATKWMAKVVNITHNSPSLIDTYANLLYKGGKRKKAIEWQQKAIEILAKKGDYERLKTYQTCLEKIVLGLPTWPTKQ